MPFYENGDVRIHFEETGSGFPILLIAGGGMDSNINVWNGSYFNAPNELSDHFRCITMDQRHALSGESSGPLHMDNPWDGFTDDQLGLMSYLGCEEFFVLGCCVGGPFIWNMIKRAPQRVTAAVMCSPSGYRPEMPTLFYDHYMKNWGPQYCERNPSITMATVDAYLNAMYTSRADFVFTVTRDFVRSCKTPVLIMPDDVPAHPYAAAMEAAALAPNSEVSIYPWHDTSEHLAEAVAHMRRFLMAHEPARTVG